MGTIVKSMLALTLAACAAGCNESKVVDGKEVQCVGLDSANENTKYAYRLDTWNVVLAVVFSETIVVPVIVVLDDLYCPVALKDQ